MSIQFDFRGRAVLVTDAASGLGSCIAAAFHELGATVAVNTPSQEEADRLIGRLGGGARLIAAPGDLASMPQVSRMARDALARLGHLDVLVCSTARAAPCAVGALGTAEWEGTLGTNLKSAFFAAQACVPALTASRGSIVNVASVIGLLGGPPGSVAYATAKGAMVQMSRMMALELAASGIRVNTICPARVEPRDPPHDDAPDPFGAWFSRRSPLHRSPSMQECAAAVLYLASPLAAATSGSVLVVDGGLSSGHYL